MSYWGSKNYAASAVDQILDKSEFTLEELLDASEIIQETTALNGRLINYLNKPEVLSKLLDHIVLPRKQGIALAEPASSEFSSNMEFVSHDQSVSALGPLP